MPGDRYVWAIETELVTPVLASMPVTKHDPTVFEDVYVAVACPFASEVKGATLKRMPHEGVVVSRTESLPTPLPVESRTVTVIVEVLVPLATTEVGLAVKASV